jgi:hypothetical protein
MVHSFARGYLDNLGSSAALGKPFFRISPANRSWSPNACPVDLSATACPVNLPKAAHPADLSAIVCRADLCTTVRPVDLSATVCRSILRDRLSFKTAQPSVRQSLCEPPLVNPSATSSPSSVSIKWSMRPSESASPPATRGHGFPRSHGPSDRARVRANGCQDVNRTAAGPIGQSARRVVSSTSCNIGHAAVPCGARRPVELDSSEVPLSASGTRRTWGERDGPGRGRFQ